jgi:Mn-dependent DtxR family transcriptional regulator
MLTDNERKAFDFVKKNKTTRTKFVAEFMKVTPAYARRILNSLANKGVVECYSYTYFKLKGK